MKFKEGDWAWSPFDGWDRVKGWCGRSGPDWPISHGGDSFTADGKFIPENKHPSLFTVEEAAKLGHYPPKQKVTKTIERWINVYPDGDAHPYHYKLESEAYKNRSELNIATVRLTGTYEVEE